MNECLNSFPIEIASDALKGRVFESSLGDLIKLDEEDSYRKFRFICEDVQGRHCLTNFHGMDITTDRLRMLVKKWQVRKKKKKIFKKDMNYCISIDIDRSSSWYPYIRWLSLTCLLHWFHPKNARTNQKDCLCPTHTSLLWWSFETFRWFLFT